MKVDPANPYPPPSPYPPQPPFSSRTVGQPPGAVDMDMVHAQRATISYPPPHISTTPTKYSGTKDLRWFCCFFTAPSPANATPAAVRGCRSYWGLETKAMYNGRFPGLPLSVAQDMYRGLARLRFAVVTYMASRMSTVSAPASCHEPQKHEHHCKDFVR